MQARQEPLQGATVGAGLSAMVRLWLCHAVSAPAARNGRSEVAPHLQPDIAIAALSHGKPVFVEKPMAADLAGAAAMARHAGALPTMMDFNFTEIMAWRKAKALLDAGAIGRLRRVAVNWNVENAST